MAALKLLCDSPALEPHLLELLSARDAQGQTPFMMGVSLRAYPAATVLLDTINVVAGKQPESEGNFLMVSTLPKTFFSSFSEKCNECNDLSSGIKPGS